MPDPDTMTSATESGPDTGRPRRDLLSLGQEQLWFLDALSPGNSVYNFCDAYRLRGDVDIEILRRSLNYLVNRHDALRATFLAEDGVPFQEIADSAQVRLPTTDISRLSRRRRENAVNGALRAEMETPFDLESGPLYRFRIMRLTRQEYVLLLSFHHIITDGWSNALFCTELAIVYQAFRAGTKPELDAPPCRYVDYVAWQREQSQGLLAEQLGYWERRLAGTPVLELPADRPRPAVPDYSGERITADLPSGLISAARAAVRTHRVTLLMLLATAVTAVLARHTGQDDIPLGVGLLGRTEPEHEKVMGLFTNIVVLRSDLSANPSMSDLLETTAEALVDAYEHQAVPFATVVDRVQPIRDPRRNPLFQVCMQLETGAGNLALPGIETERLQVPITRSQFDLLLTFTESSGRMRIEADYSTELFDRGRMEALLGHVQRAIEAICTDPRQRLSEISLLTEGERAELLAAGRGQPGGQPPEPVHVAVTRTAEANPDATAAICRGESISYRELERRAGALASYLRTRGIGHEDIVAIAMNRDLLALVALLGVMKADAAYTILDTAHPAARMDFMLRDTRAPLLLTTSDVAKLLPEPAGWQVVELDRERAAIEAPGLDGPGGLATGGSLAYVLYTSGSTGKPKGVLLEHRALLSFARAYGRLFDLHDGDRMLQLSALSFDMCHGEIFAGLIAGATLVLVPREAETPDEIARLMRDERVTFISMAPAMLALLDADPYPHLAKMQAGGDVLPPEVVNKWTRPGRRLFNVYGPTETAVTCTAYECDPDVTWRKSPPIGRPFPDRRMYVTDRWGNLSPKGVPGELLIGGDEGVARGYLNRPELTAEKFISDPFYPGGRVYRSGDLVRWTDDWQLEFLGRIDTQIKLNGLRIELEEIESILASHPDVGMAAAAVRTGRGAEAVLTGYVTPATDRRPDPARLRQHLRERLPEYMVPAAWMILDKLPLTTAQKVDRNALPGPETSTAQADERPFVAPRTETEATVAEAFATVLDLPRIGADDNLFEAGGNSLAAMRALNRINKALGVRLNVRALYGASTIADVAALVDELRADAQHGDGRS